ncbi:MAG: AAA family ATPase [Alphaproteobacteria bacterium]
MKHKQRYKVSVTRLTLTDFRNYAHLRLNAELAPIVITGENGSGKTNILEAISFLTPGRGCAAPDFRHPAHYAVSGGLRICPDRNKQYQLGGFGNRLQ